MEVTVGRRREKRWAALFTYLTTRAVHMEVASLLSADSMIMALQRFIARRGQPDTLYSDHGTNFVGAAAELARAHLEIQERMSDEATTRAIRWLRIFPHAPHMAGSWERLVRSIKVALSATLHTRAPRDEVLHTLLMEAEFVGNCRPLTHISVLPGDPTALTPNHFLLGSAAGRRQPGHFNTYEECSRKQLRASQALAKMAARIRCRDVTSGQRGGHRSSSETRSSSPIPPYHATHGRGASSKRSTRESTGKCEWWTFARLTDEAEGARRAGPLIGRTKRDARIQEGGRAQRTALLYASAAHSSPTHISSVRALGPNGRPRAPAPSALSTTLLHCVFCADRRPAAPRDPPGPADRESAAPPATTLHTRHGRWPFPFSERQTRTDLGPPALEGAPRRYQVSPAHPPSSLTPSSVPRLLVPGSRQAGPRRLLFAPANNRNQLGTCACDRGLQTNGQA
ncbi:hypothetical protein EVAR_30750_1 [Eumeta japonica]|uniref:Integrase catalytic domain-containing protein n=1 Tax=Eumeta variegata TaxID=151549 RepID=A0A4C1V7B6_EUMVA|nr:hypothetical protein EVAR_30750_1 [Eumeta japonica]